MAATEAPIEPSSSGRPGSVAGFVAAWLGWAFDGMDGFMYSLVAIPFVGELLAKGTPGPEVAKYASIIQAIFLVGWAAGGFVFGRMGDSLGRSRTLTITIITYSVFTGMAFFAHTWWELAIFRFLAALGIGGEWAAGSALVAETLRSKFRPWASALLQSGYMGGMVLAALAVGALGGNDPRYLFLVGVLPAFATILIRLAVPEPPSWQSERAAQALPPISALFKPPVLRTTLFVLSLVSLALTASWAMLYFNVQILRGLPEVKSMTGAEQGALIRNVTIGYACWCIVGNFVAAGLAKLVGYRVSMILMMAGGLASYLIGFSHPRGLADVQIWFDLTASTGLALFSLFPLYIPPMFPTLLRTTGAGFCYNTGRLFAAAGTVFLGVSTSAKVSPYEAIYYSGFLYIPMIVIALFMPVLKEELS
jgi:MFS family permease